MTGTNELGDFEFGEGGYSVVYFNEDNKDFFPDTGVDGYEGPGWYVIDWKYWVSYGPYEFKAEADALLNKLTSPRPVQSKRTF